jgi:hypothetical protein
VANRFAKAALEQANTAAERHDAQTKADRELASGCKGITHTCEPRTCVPCRSGFPIPGGPGFAEECRRQSLVVAAADASDRDLDDFLEAALADLDGEADA